MSTYRRQADAAMAEGGSQESKQVADQAAEEARGEEKEAEEPPIDSRLVDALENPTRRLILLHMETKIQELIANPDQQQVEFHQCISSSLRMLASVLALHYGLIPDCSESTRVFATKKPDSRIPSVTLSGIAKFNPRDKLTTPFEKGSSDTSSSNLCAPEMTKPDKKSRLLEEREVENPNGNLSVHELSKPEKRTRTLEEGEKQTSSMYAQETTEAADESKEAKPISDLSVPEKTEPEKGAKTLEERKEGKPASNMSAQETTKAEKRNSFAEERKEEKLSNPSAPEKTEPGKGARTSEEGKSPTLVDPHLVDGVRHPKFGRILLSMEVKIQEAIQNTNLQEVEFPQCSSTYLRKLAGILALHYGLEPHCTESTRVFATKMPDSRIPLVTLSGISKFNPGDKLTTPFLKCSSDASFRNLPVPEMTELEKRASILENTKEEKPDSNLSAPELTEPEKMARTLEEGKEKKPASNMSAQKMTEGGKGKEEKPIDNLSAQEKTESDKGARTLAERKEEKPISNSSSSEKTDTEEKGAIILEEKKEKKPSTSVDSRLVAGVRHPKFGKILLSIEVKIQKFMQNPHLQEVEFPQCSTSHLRGLADLLALHYGLEPHCNEGVRVFARKKADSRIPLVTLSSIPGDKVTIPYKKHSGSAPSRNLSPLETIKPELRARTLEECKEEKSNMCPPEMTEPKKSAKTLEEMEDKPTSKEEKQIDNLSAQEKTESEKGARTLQERKEEKPISNLCTLVITETEKKGARTLEERKENKLPTSVDSRLVEGVRHPRFGKILLSMEVKIQQFMQNPNLQEIEFPQCSSAHLRGLADLLALHYSLEPHCNEGVRVFARKKADSRIPLVTLSSIPGDKLTIPFVKHSGGASSCNLSSLEMTKPELRARTLEECKEEKPNMFPREMTELEEKPTSNLSTPEMSEADMSIRTLQEIKDEKAASNLSAHEMAEAANMAGILEKWKEEDKGTNSRKKPNEDDPSSNLSVRGMCEPEKMTRTMVEREDEVKSPISVDPRLADAVKDPQVRKILLGIEAKIQQVIQNPNLQEVEFPECSSSHLRTLSGILALHYGLEPHCTLRVCARKKPESRIPSITLSGIPKIIPKDKLAVPTKKHSDSASSSNLSAQGMTKPEEMSRTLKKKWRRKKYDKARQRIFNESAPSSSILPVVSSSISAVVSSSTSALKSSSTYPVVSKSIPPIVSSFMSPKVSSSTSAVTSKLKSPVVLSSISPEESSYKPALISSSASPIVSRAVSSVVPRYNPPVVSRSVSSLVSSSISAVASQSKSLVVSSSMSPVVSSYKSAVISSSTPQVFSSYRSALISSFTPQVFSSSMFPVVSTSISSVSSVVSSSTSAAVPKSKSPVVSSCKPKLMSRSRSAGVSSSISPVPKSKFLMFLKSRYRRVSSSESPVVSSYKSASVSSSTSPVVSRSMPPAISNIPPVVSSSTSPVVSSSIPPVVSDFKPAVDSSPIPPVGSSLFAPVVSSSVSPVVSNFFPPVAESSTAVASLYPVISSSISAVVSNSIPTEASSSISTVSNGLSTAGGQDNLSSRHEVVHNPSSNLNSSTRSVGTGAFHPGPVTDQHPQEMQHRESVSQPAAASTSPYMLTPYGNYNVNYPHYASGAMYSPLYYNFTPWPLETYYAPADPFFTQQPPVQYATQPYHASGNNLAYSSSMQYPLVQYMPTYDASGAMYNPAYFSYTQWPSVQYTQSFNPESTQYGARPLRSSGTSVQDTSSEEYLSVSE